MDIYTETEDVDPDTLAHLGPLAALAGVWEGQGLDVHPIAHGDESEPYLERAEFHPIDPQSNGPQLLYGLRYHLSIQKLGEVETFHDQLGYWLWEPATQAITQTLGIPRAQVAMASGTAAPDAKRFTVRATLGSPTAGIVSGPFLDANFKTLSYELTITINPDGTIAYDQDTVLQIAGRDPFHHTDKNVWRRVGPALPNPRMR